MRLYKEWCPQLYSRKGFMVPLEDLDKIVKYAQSPGYSSVYAFKEEDALLIKESGSSSGFDRFEPSADALPIDLDDGDASLDEVLDKLKGYSYDHYFSGKKGHHIILRHNWITDRNLPYSHRSVIEGLGIKCDMTLYQAGRIFRLPRCIHEKTGKRKTLISVHEGDLIDIPIVEKPKTEFNFTELEGGSIGDSLYRLCDLGMNGAIEGQRHMRIWGVATDLLKAGFEVSAVMSILTTVNNSWPVPMEEEEVENAVRQAYRRLGK